MPAAGARIDADHPAIIRSRCHVLRLGGEKLRASCGEPRFGLRYVGARYFADVEAVARLLELLGQDFDVAPLQIEHRLIAQQIHISGRGIEQHLLLGDTQGLARRIHLTFRLTGPIRRLEAVEQGVGAVGADRARIEVLREWARHKRAAEREYRCRVLIIVAAGRGDAEFRAIARQSLRHIFVGRAQRGPLRVQRRIILIGLH